MVEPIIYEIWKEFKLSLKNFNRYHMDKYD